MTVGLLSFVSLIPPSATRVLVIGYGQSNMGTFMTDDPLGSPNTNSLYYDSFAYGSHTPTNTIISPVGFGSGMITCINQINNVTGLPVLFVGSPVGGSSIPSLVPGQAAWTALAAAVNAVIQPTDYVVMIWDQGEGDAGTAPPEVPQDYIDNMTLIQQGLAAITGLSNSPVLVAGLGSIWWSTPALAGQPSGGNSQYTWQRIRNAHFFCGVQIPHVYFSHTNIDILRANATDYHYIQNTPMGQRFAQGVTNLMGRGPLGFAHWEIASAATVDATHTNVNLLHSLGTDFTPTTAADGWQVSGDNGANWVNGVGARNSSTQLQLTHSSLSTSSARLVRYQWGWNQAGASAGPTPGLLRDNSAFTIPLTPTTWDIKPTPLSTVPCPTWRNVDTLTGTFSAWTSRKLLCWPTSDNYQKFLIIAVYSGFPIDPIGNLLTLVVHPDVGSQVTATFVAEHPSNTGMAFYQVLLGTDANAAQYITITGSQPSSPSTGYTCHIYDVNAATLNSTTNTGTNSATTTVAANTTPPLTSNCTVNVSAGGMMIAMNVIDANQTTAGAFATYSSNFNNRFENGGNVTLDAANSSANAASPFSISYGTTNPSSPINMYTFMAAWR